MENITTTKITDLPNNIKQNNQSIQNQQYTNNINMVKNNERNHPTYTQLNIHTNPLNNSQNNIPLPLNNPSSTCNTDNKINNNIILDEITPTFSLPSRDIPMNTINVLQDEKIKPNYIPNINNNYIPVSDENVYKKNKKTKDIKKIFENFLIEIQIPIFIGILFFIFQLPIVNVFLFKNFTFLNTHNEDGTLNVYGIFFKSILFSLLFYFLENLFETILCF